MNTKLTARLERVKSELRDMLLAYAAAFAEDTKYYRTARALLVAIEGLEKVVGCFDAAITEGLHERIGENDRALGSLNDLVTRRLLFAYDAAMSQLTEICTTFENEHTA